ncbi:MAG TPA: sugar phosphate nucleotidyltransferase [Opitutaceae bacterium]|nr:sugar phosphate nucleotidyltransferase [Opitutaceae bacterium]
MKVRKALVTAANPRQRALPLQMLIDQRGEPKSALQIILEEAAGAGIEEFGVIVCPGDELAYAGACGALRERVRFVPQRDPQGYGHAVLCGREFIGDEAFLHLVGDHLHVAHGATSCARQLVDVAAAEDAPVSAVQPTHESLLTAYGTVGGRLVGGDRPLYQIETVLEKPTPTVAEQQLLVPGLRAGFYLCFFGMHVLPAGIFDLLEEQRAGTAGRPLGLSPALHALAARRRYLALSIAGRRYDIGASYGLLFAQLALSLAGRDRDPVLTQLVELLATRPS